MNIYPFLPVASAKANNVGCLAQQPPHHYHHIVCPVTSATKSQSATVSICPLFVLVYQLLVVTQHT